MFAARRGGREIGVPHARGNLLTAESHRTVRSASPSRCLARSSDRSSAIGSSTSMCRYVVRRRSCEPSLRRREAVYRVRRCREAPARRSTPAAHPEWRTGRDTDTGTRPAELRRPAVPAHVVLERQLAGVVRPRLRGLASGSGLRDPAPVIEHLREMMDARRLLDQPQDQIVVLRAFVARHGSPRCARGARGAPPSGGTCTCWSGSARATSPA